MSIKMTNEAKTGIMVFICLAVLGALLMKVGNFSFVKKGYAVKARFHYTEGVKKNAPVRLSGVDVGDVKDVKLIYGDEVLVEADLWLNEGTKLRKNSKAYVTTLGMMGEKYIEIRPGSMDAAYAVDGDMIDSKDPVRLEDLIEIGTKVADDIGKMARDISKVANHVDGAVVDNRQKLDKIFDNLEETSENFAEFSQDVKHHPWKVLMKGKEKPKDELTKEREARRQERQAAKQNFAAKAS
jgi:phospholipid/cholesterol/gamma-HCH transport system substrate-binding protein